MEQLGFWELVHGTSAGCASIIAFEGLREVIHGAALLAIYAIVTYGLFWLHHKHATYMRNKRHVAELNTRTQYLVANMPQAPKKDSEAA